MKDEDEIANARIAAELCNAAMAAIEISLIGVGTEEHAVASAWNAAYNLWRAEYGGGNINGFGSLEGGDLYGIKPWVHAGQRRFLQIDKPSGSLIRDEAVSAYVWTCFNGIHAELERTICVGEISSAQHDAIARIQNVRAEVFSMIKPGVALNALYKTACAHLREYGYALPGRIGHGIGLGAHEHLSIDESTNVRLEEGMLLTIEPNVEVPEDNVTTQYSDTIVVTVTGYDFLAPYGKDPVRGL